MEQALYQVRTVKDYQDSRFLAINRLDSARGLHAASYRPADFDIDGFILREFGIRLVPEPLRLVLRIRVVSAKYLVVPEESLQPA